MVVGQSDRDRRRCCYEAGFAIIVSVLVAVAVGHELPENFKVVARNENGNLTVSDLFELIVTLEKRVKVQEEFLGHIAAAAIRITGSTSPTPDVQPSAPAPVPATTFAPIPNNQTEFQPNKDININAKPELRVTYKDPDCFNGQTFGNPLFIISPLFPDAYPANRLCRWVIEAPPEHTSIHFRFTNFAVKPCSGCSCDYVEVLDLRPDNSTYELGRFCGSVLPEPFHTTSNRLQIVFRSDSAPRSFKGFKVKLSF